MQEELVEGLKNIFKDNLVSIVLYGSFARGTNTADSDIDIAIILKQEYDKVSRDKVIDLRRQLENCSNLWMQNNGNQKKLVTCNDIEKIISNMTGIPVEQMTSSESQRILNMENELHNTVIGQENAVNIISGAVRRSRAGIGRDGRGTGGAGTGAGGVRQLPVILWHLYRQGQRSHHAELY